MNTSDELISRCEKIFIRMKEYYENHQESCTGFNFSYSPRKSWEAMPNVLLLTHHPAPQESDARRPTLSLWPLDENDFFNSSVWGKRTYPEGILTIAAEIASCKEGIDYTPSMNNKDLEDFVNANMVLASFVPFRTSRPTEDAVNFSKEKYWEPILEIWQPEVIIAIGKHTFEYIDNSINQIGWNPQLKYDECTYKFGVRCNKHILPSQGNYRINSYANKLLYRDIYVIGVPDPYAYKPTTENPNTNYGYPDPTLYIPNKAPIQDFIGKALYYIGMQRHG